MRKICLIAALIILVFSGCAVEQGMIEPTAKQKVCTVDDDCVTVPAGCDGCGCGEPINKIYREEYMEELQESCKQYDGPVCEVFCTPYEVKCVNNSCSKEFPGDENKQG